MAKVIFKTFQEASAFSKNLSMTIKATTTVRREGDSWWVDDLGVKETGTDIVQLTSANQTINTQKQHDILSEFDENGFDKDGFNRHGFDKNDNHRSGIGNHGCSYGGQPKVKYHRGSDTWRDDLHNL